jgi:Uma2 family endonuclease
MARQTALGHIRDHGDIPANLVDLQEYLGGIPFERISLMPPPGTAVEADLWRWKLCELVDGVIVIKALNLLKTSLATDLLMAMLKWQEQTDPRGHVFGNVGHRFPNGNIRIPNLTYCSSATWAGRPIDDSLIDFPADLVVEFQVPGNTAREMQRKLHEHLEFGVRQVWIVDIVERGVWVSLRGEPDARWLGLSNDLTIDSLSPGFRLSIRDWFAEAEAAFKPHH